MENGDGVLWVLSLYQNHSPSSISLLSLFFYSASTPGHSMWAPFAPLCFYYICYVSMAKDQKWKAMDVRVAVSGPSLHPRKVSLFAMLIESLFSDGSFWYILFPFLLLTFPVYKDFFLFRKVSLFFFFIRK